MAKNSNGLATKVKVSVGIVTLLVVFAGIVTGFVKNTGSIGANTAVIKEHKAIDTARDEKAAIERNELENEGIGIKKDIKHIKEGMAEQKVLSKERHIEQKTMLKGISDEIKAIHRSP